LPGPAILSPILGKLGMTKGSLSTNRRGAMGLTGRLRRHESSERRYFPTSRSWIAFEDHEAVGAGVAEGDGGFPVARESDDPGAAEGFARRGAAGFDRSRSGSARRRTG